MNTIPTLSELYQGVLFDLEAEFTGTVPFSIPLFGPVALRALAAVQAGKLWLIYKTLGGVQKNIFVDTADSEASGGTLERFGRVKLNRNPFPARAGQYTVTVTGTVGATLPASTTFKSDDTSTSPGKLFVLDVAYTLTATSDTITLRALEAGLDSELDTGDTLTATAPIANVNAGATVVAATVEPLAAEDIEEYRRKAIEAYRQEPQGGAATDYRLWAFDAQGVQQTYPYAASGLSGEINLYVEATVLDSTDGKGTPSAGLLADVEEVVEFDPDTTKPLNERGRRPLGTFQVNYLPVTIKEIDIVIASFSGLTAAIQTLLLSAITAEVNLVRPFVSAADILDDKNDTLDTNKIIAVILNARPGSVFGAVTLKVDGVTVSTYTFLNGDIPHLNTVTYT